MAQKTAAGLPTIGAVIRAWRLFRRLTSTELSKKAGVRIAYLSEIEHDRTINPKEEYLVKLANALGVPLQDIYGRRMPPEKEDKAGEAEDDKEQAISSLSPSDLLAATGTFGSPDALVGNQAQQLPTFEEEVRQILTSAHLPYAKRMIAQQMILEASRIICWGLKEAK